MEEHGMAKKDAMATARGSKLVTALAAAFAILVASHGAAACTKGTTGNRTADGKAADKKAGGPMAELSVKRLGTVAPVTRPAAPLEISYWQETARENPLRNLHPLDGNGGNVGNGIGQ
jgi:hypothetical protein